ncbi:MAG: hypothetical protein IKL96_00375, partial [Kiritimatiellae bacterium]|nr:hypothetical protein [Kiritimatiellia bacterium]
PWATACTCTAADYANRSRRGGVDEGGNVHIIDADMEPREVAEVNPDIRYSRARGRSQNGNAMPSADEQRRMEKFAAAAGGLTAGRKDGTLAAVDQKRLTAVMRGLGSGELKHPRFTKEEAAASEGTEHERLWNFILSLESSEVHPGGGQEGPSRIVGDASQSGGWLGQFRRMATRYESDPGELIDSSFKFLDKGAESQVYVGEHSDKVLKVRKLSPYSLDGVKSELAKIVYHNYLFPKDAYTLRDIAVWDDNGYDQFYLILEQPLVTPKTDAAGNIIAPSEGQIFEALNKTKQRFRIYDEAWDRQGADEFDTTDSDDSSADFVPSARKIAYNGQFMVYDFKPGRNTFIDAETGEVRFIDPRVDINDPGAGFSVSRFGKRKAVNGTASFEGAPSAGMEGNPDVRLSRGGYKPGDWRKTFTFGRAARGDAERTPEQQAYFLQEAQGLLDWFYGREGSAGPQPGSRPEGAPLQGARGPRQRAQGDGWGGHSRGPGSVKWWLATAGEMW